MQKTITVKESNEAMADLMEDMGAAGAAGVFGGVEMADGIANGDNYASGDQRSPKSGKVQSRIKNKKKKCKCKNDGLERCDCNVLKVTGKPL